MKRPVYFDKYPTIAFERDELGILVMRLHSEDGPVAYAPQLAKVFAPSPVLTAADLAGVSR